ncbi:MAG: hypothetical protein EXR79_07775 [Myxococcales bacterium]|nr:hypothetical protein [Myxococcales bacterium]
MNTSSSVRQVAVRARLAAVLVAAVLVPAVALSLPGCATSEEPAKVQPLPFGAGAVTPAAPATPAAKVPAAGVPVAVCEALASKCGALDHRLACAADGSAWQPVACDPGSACEDGECRALVCDPAGHWCDGATVATCSARGTSIVGTAACQAGQACVGGKCVAAVCKAGSIVCTGHAVATCKADGLGWTQKVCRSDESCDPAGAGPGKAACLEQICPIGELWCNAGRAVQCDALGLHETLMDDCLAAGAACIDGACVPYACQAGVVACDGSAVATCKPTGMGWATKACTAGHACAYGACQPLVCAAKELFCDGEGVAHCNASGTDWDVVQTCAKGTECKQGKCVVQTIVCGDGLCDAGEAAACAKDCKPITLVAPDFDQLGPTVPTTQPRAPRPATKLAAPAWLGGKPLALHGPTLFVVDTDNGKLVRLDRQTLQVASALPVGGRPEHVVVGPNGTAFVASRDAGTVVRVPWGSAKADATWPVGKEPWGLALSADAKHLYVTLAGEGALVRLDAVTGQELARASVGERPKGVTLTPAGQAVVVSGTGSVARIDVGQLKPKLPDVQAPVASMVFLRTTNPVPACNGEATKKVRAANRATAVALEPETGGVYVVHTLVSSGSAQEVLQSVGVKPPEKPQQFVVKCSGGYGSTCSKVPVPPPPGDPVCVGNPVRPYEVSVSWIGPNGSLKPTVAEAPIKDDASGRSWYARYDQPMDIVLHPTLSLAFVAARGSNNVAVLNTAAPDPMMWPVADVKVGDGPKALAIAPDGKTLYTLEATGFTISVTDLAPLAAFAEGALGVEANPADLPKMKPLYLAAAKSTAYAQDPLSPAARIGRKVFHYANNARLSVSNRFACATCHLDGTEDKQVWFIAEGPRQTPVLAERLADTAPYNWMGSKFTLADNIVGTTARMGGSGLLPAELEGLMKFLLEGLKAPPNPNVAATGLTPQQLAGKLIFESAEAACATCHVPGALTDGAQHDVGTATDVEVQVASVTGKSTKLVYNTPSLRGLFHSAPYLHDGSAATLQDALKKTASTMGKTAHLSAGQLDSLVAYLQTL